MTATATRTACQASRRRARALRPLVSARNSGMVPTGSMITTSVTNTDVNSLRSKASCMAWRGYPGGPAASGMAPSGDARRSAEAGRHRAEGQLGLDVAVTQVAELERVVEQHTRRGRPDQRPEPQRLGLADERRAVVGRRERPQRGRMTRRLQLGVRRTAAESVAGARPGETGMPGAGPHAGLFGDEHQLARPAERARSGWAGRDCARALAVVAGAREPADHPARGQYVRHPDRHLG